MRKLPSSRLRPFILLLILTVGCKSKPSGLGMPPIEPEVAADSAMRLYDLNSDGAISGAELNAIPSIKSAVDKIDTNGNKSVEKEELVARLKTLLDSRFAVFPATVTVTKNGKSVPGAVVAFTPEEFMKEMIDAGTGTADGLGIAEVTTVKARYGMQPGYYRLTISLQENGKERIPAKYNTDSKIGAELTASHEVSQGALGMQVDIAK